MKFKIVEKDKSNHIIKVWYESSEINLTGNPIKKLETLYNEVLNKLDKEYNLFIFNKRLETIYSDNHGEYSRDTTTDYWALIDNLYD